MRAAISRNVKRLLLNAAALGSILASVKSGMPTKAVGAGITLRPVFSKISTARGMCQACVTR